MKKSILDTNFFEKNGYLIIKKAFFHQDIKKLTENVVKKINSISKKKIINNISKIHDANINDKIYKNIIKSSSRYISVNNSFLKKIQKNKNIINIFNNYWKYKYFDIYWVGDPKKREIKKNQIGFRIARPKEKRDAAKAHVDNYNNDMKLFLTLWIPLIGFSKNYVLNIFPKTHKLDHNRQIQKKRKNISKSFSDIYLKKFKQKRFNLSKGDAILFHPNLIHGSSYNFGNKTRVSVEVRMFNKKKFSVKSTFDKRLNAL